MFYIFNAENKCITTCGTKPSLTDLKTRDEYFVESEELCEIGFIYLNKKFVRPVVTIDYEAKARSLRNAIRSKIDTFLRPAATFKDNLITDSEKQLLINDSVVLASWPSQEGWPYIPLPELSDLCSTLINIPVWEY